MLQVSICYKDAFDAMNWLLQKMPCRPLYVLSIGLFKIFSRWILHIFNTQKESDIDRKLVAIMQEIKEEDLLANCMQIKQ